MLEKLREVSAQLQNGVLSKAINTSVAKEIKDKPSLLKFCETVQQYLGISAVQSSNLICSFLINEYKGSASSLINCLSADQQKHKLLVDIAKYYALERIIILKIVRNLLELFPSKSHPYSNEYHQILTELKIASLRKSYIDQFEHLIKEVSPANQPVVGDYLSSNARLVTWSERKIRESIEVLQIILLTIEHDGISPEEFSRISELFRMHSFGRQQQYLDSKNTTHIDLVVKLTYSEVAIFLKCVDWTNTKYTFSFLFHVTY